MRLASFVALGGAIGSVSRYLLTLFVQQLAGTGFPVGTLTVNVIGAFVLGLIARFGVESAALSPEIRLMLTTGFCGGFTTFSTFSYESARLIEDGQMRSAILYMLLSVIISLLAMFVGFRAAHWLRTVG